MSISSVSSLDTVRHRQLPGRHVFLAEAFVQMFHQRMAVLPKPIHVVDAIRVVENTLLISNGVSANASPDAS